MEKTLYVHEFKNYSIYKQLQIEEALLRCDLENHIIINEGSPDAIVMGISSKPETVVNFSWPSITKIPVIRRFSGGGCVFVDKNTLFISFIFHKNSFDFPLFPEPILRWTEKLYKEAWEIPHFHVKENDYVIKEKKCGGNAQYIQKERWLHHTSFLWDFKKENMTSLLFPPKTPLYRKERSHLDFLTPLKNHTSSKKALVENLKRELEKTFILKKGCKKKIFSILQKKHRKSVCFIEKTPLVGPGAHTVNLFNQVGTSPEIV